MIRVQDNQQNDSMAYKSKANLGLMALAVSIVFLAGALVYFASQLVNLKKAAASLAVYRDVVPKLVEEIEHVRRQTPLILKESAAIRAQLSQQLPTLTAEVAAVRKMLDTRVPEVIDEVGEYRRTVVPEVLSESKFLRLSTIPAVLSESKALRQKTIPNVLHEVKMTRTELPQLLTQASDLARSAGKEASRGAVSGFFTGILTAPIDMMSGVANSAFKGDKLSKKDLLDVAKAGQQVLLMDEVGASQSWHNKKSGNNGIVSIEKMSVDGNESCRVLKFEAVSRGKNLQPHFATVCRGEDGSWLVSKYIHIKDGV